MKSHSRAPHRALVIALSSAVPFHATAQQQGPTQLEPVVVTGNPLGSTRLAAPVSVLAGDELVIRRAGTLGEILNSLPGVSSTYFGPNSSRPIVRGLDGDRVRVLNNAGASLDASSLSFDHAVPIDPLVVERIEVLRGPGALLYGGSAVGGVVNALDNRIPKYSLQGLSGAAELRLGGAEHERGGAALLEAGNGSIALHADAFGRGTSDLRVPRHTPVDAGQALEPTDRVRNSAARTSGGALGGSLTFASGYLGVSADTYDSRYGIVVEPDVTIQMEREHVGLAGEIRDLGGPLRTARVQLNDTRYRHQEIEGSGAVGTTFKTSGTEARIELEHAPLGPLHGVVGAQFEDVDFSALGDEAFVPDTTTRRQALFVVEEATWPLGTLSAGVRIERAKVASAGDADPAELRFGAAAKRSFTLRSASLANVYALDERWSLSGSFSLTERAPTSFELFADGIHAATRAFERGDPTLGAERGNNLDLALQWKSGGDHLRVGVFNARFARFISLEASGAAVDEIGEDGRVESFPEFVFRPVRARLHGVEIEGRHRLAGMLSTLAVSGKLDLTRATNIDTGEPLPRIAPLRATVGLDAADGPWAGRFEVEHAARQSRVPATDVATDAYTLVNLSLSRRFDLGGGTGSVGQRSALWFLKLTNLGNELGYNASTVGTIRGLVPLPGRALKTGVRLTF